MAKYSSCIVFLLYICSTVKGEVCYIRDSQSPSDENDNITLFQLVSNTSNYLTNETRLIFAPGSYTLESELIVEDIHSLSISVESCIPSSKVVIICGNNKRIGFRNVSMVTVSCVDFDGCIETDVLSVGWFKLENSNFNIARVNGTTLIIDDSIASLDKVAFISKAGNRIPNGISVKVSASNISITHSRFTGLVGSAIYVEHGSDLTVFNSTFKHFYYYYKFTFSIVYAVKSIVKIYDSNFEQNYQRVITTFGSILVIIHSRFVSNTLIVVVYTRNSDLKIAYSEFVGNYGCLEMSGTFTNISHSTIMYSTFSNNIGRVLNTNHINMINIHHSEFVNNNYTSDDLVSLQGKNIIICHSEFVNNTYTYRLVSLQGKNIIICHSEFVNNTYTYHLVRLKGKNIIICHSEFVNNTSNYDLIYLDGNNVTVSQSEFIYNRVFSFKGLIYIAYLTTPENITNNVFINNTAAYDVFIRSLFCRSNFSLSLGNTRCIECPENRYDYLVGIIIVAFIAGIALVIVMLALNMTVAVGTLNGILFYANVVATNADTYFWPFQTSNFITVFISWLNLNIGFDVCFIKEMTVIPKSLLQLAFPTYITVLVIIVIVASECSSKFAKIIGKGNPVAVLDTMVLLSYTNFFNVIIGSIYLLHSGPAYGSQNIDLSKTISSGSIKGVSCFLLIIFILIFLLGILYTALVFFWQWLVKCQTKDLVICKWVKYQKLHHFIEPYHAPYTTKYRFWTGFLLIIRVLLSLISVLSFNPQVNLMSTIFVVGLLLLIKGVTAKRIYKSWPLDVMETAIYFNIIAFAALTWYNLGSGGNQIAVAYMSVMIMFILLLAVISFHFLRYTQFSKCSLVKKSFSWISSNLINKTTKEEICNDELDGYQLERHEDQDQPTVTQSVIEIHLSETVQ